MEDERTDSVPSRNTITCVFVGLRRVGLYTSWSKPRGPILHVHGHEQNMNHNNETHEVIVTEEFNLCLKLSSVVNGCIAKTYERREC